MEHKPFYACMYMNNNRVQRTCLVFTCPDDGLLLGSLLTPSTEVQELLPKVLDPCMHRVVQIIVVHICGCNNPSCASCVNR